MKPVIVIPSYWADNTAGGVHTPGAYDHSTDINDPNPDLERCLASLEQVRDVAPVIVLAVCPNKATAEVGKRVRQIAAAHEKLDICVVTNKEAVPIIDAVGNLAPGGTGECVSLRGYGAIRNMGLVCAAVFGYDAVVFLDDDEVVLGPDFMKKALYAVGALTRQNLPILAKSGYFYDRSGSPLADETKNGLCHKWWTKRTEFNQWMKKALAGTRISRSNYVCGGLLALHARAFTRVAFDPFITRGEDLDYLFNMRMQGMDVWFDNQWMVKHLPPQIAERSPRFMQDVYRWYYERAKLAHVSRQPDLTAVSPMSLMPYPGPWVSRDLDERVRKTVIARTFLTREHGGYWRIWRKGIAEAEEYARQNKARYLQFQSFWPTIMDGLWNNGELAKMLRDAQ